jgi:hypothetical protein
LNGDAMKEGFEEESDSGSEFPDDAEFNGNSPTIYDNRTLLNEETCAIYRDSDDNYKALERLFGTMTVGMAFGETGFLTGNDNKKRFYNAVALSECYCLTISLKDF